MRSGDLATGAARLDKAWKLLLASWEDAKTQWHDPVSQEFESRYLDQLDPTIRAALVRMRTLASVLVTAQNECDDRPGE